MAIEKVIIKAFEDKGNDNYGNPTWKVLLEDGRHAYLSGAKLVGQVANGAELELDLEEKSNKNDPSKKYWKGRFPGDGGGKGGGRSFDPTPALKSAALDAAVRLCIHNSGGEKVPGAELKKTYEALFAMLYPQAK